MTTALVPLWGASDWRSSWEMTARKFAKGHDGASLDLSDSVRRFWARSDAHLFPQLSVLQYFNVPMKKDVNQTESEPRKAIQMCCLVSFTIIFAYTCRCLLFSLWLLPRLSLCLQLVSVQCSDVIIFMVPEFSGGLSKVTSWLPLNSTLGEAPQRWRKLPKQAT